MKCEVRSEEGELVGWLKVAVDQDSLCLQGATAPFSCAVGADDPPIPEMIQIYRRRFVTSHFAVTASELEALKGTSLFEPLITRETLLEAEGVEAGTGIIHPYDGEPADGEALGRRAELVVRRVLEVKDPR